MKKIVVAAASLVLAAVMSVACTPQQRLSCYEHVPAPYAQKYCR